MDFKQRTIVFTTVGVQEYGFDVFSVHLHPFPNATVISETRLTDGISVNFNAQFIDNDNTSITFVSDRSGSEKIYRTSNSNTAVTLCAAFNNGASLFHDRPTLRDGFLYFVSAHEPSVHPFKNSSAVYRTGSGDDDGGTVRRLTPPGFVDYSPAVSDSGEWLAVASYGNRTWKGEIQEIDTEITIFRTSEPDKRVVVCRGGWPTWAGDSTVFFHRKGEDGWWSIYRVEVNNDLDNLDSFIIGSVVRVTPSGLHAFTPSATRDGKWIAVATKRKEREIRHIEIVDTRTCTLYPITETINPNINHYNPFFSHDSTRLGYHRFRGESESGSIPLLENLGTTVPWIRMVRIHGTFPSSSPTGDLIAVNGDFLRIPGLMVVRSDGSKRWNLLKDRLAFYTSWNPKEKGVVYTSVGPIFSSPEKTVQIVRVSFNPDELDHQNENEVAVDVKVLTNEKTGNNAFPSCSPDGKHIVFRSGRDGMKNLYILDAVNGESDNGDGTGIRRLTDGDWIDTMPNWSPKGDLIAFSSNRHSPSNKEVFSIYLVRPDGSGLRRIELVGPEWSGRERVNHPCFSPDGEWLTFVANFDGVYAEPVSMPNQFQPYGDVYISRIDGTCLSKLTCNSYENGTPAWHTDGVEMAIGLADDGFHNPISGQFDDPLWLTCDI
ncbi:tolB protein-related [Zostera marina]|uniref:TolB protein-related n=1 Tax=Zostera marina TaxID=29655 RepID=A0A0K9NL57_ZOSMR|nr:tolB protein-related [Zostera marina]